MKNNPPNLEAIEAYLQGKLAGRELSEFIEKITCNPLFSKEPRRDQRAITCSKKILPTTIKDYFTPNKRQ